MNSSFFDDETPLVRLDCYEPAGLRLELDAPTLLRHLLLIGGTGAGKTSILNVMLGQLLSARVGGQPVGLLILDGKQDDTVLRIQKLAAEARRPVQVLTPGGALGYDLFSSLCTLDDVAAMAQRLVLGAGPLGGDNAYWDNMRATMLEAALSLLVVKGTPIAFDPAIEFMRVWFFGSEADPAPVNELVQHAQSVAAVSRLPAAITQKIKQSLDAVKLWQKLDSRTRSIVQSILLTVLNPLLSSRAGLLFATDGRPVFQPELIVNQGGVVIVSLNALTEPDLTRLIFRLVKNDFYQCAQRRLAGPLCGLVMDEYPLAVGFDDLENLQTLRSRGAFVIAATQGFLALDQMVGSRIRQALVAGFQNILAMQSHEPEVDLLMAMIMGQREIIERRKSFSSDSDLLELIPSSIGRQMVPVCPPGALARLQAFQAYVSLANGVHPSQPVWLVPRFVKVDPPPPAVKPPDPLAQVLAEVAGQQPALPPAASVAGVVQMMARFEAPQLMSVEIWRATVQLCAPKTKRQVLMREANRLFRENAAGKPLPGLKTLPACWLRGLPALLKLYARQDFYDLKEVDGCLLIQFSEGMEWPPKVLTIPQSNLLALLNWNLYPSLWRPLKRRHWQLLYATRPELRPQLQIHAKAVGWLMLA